MNPKEIMGLFRKSFEEKYLRKRSTEEIERDKLSDELHVLFYPHSNERQYYFDLGFPTAAWKPSDVEPTEYFNWKPKVRSGVSADEIRLMLYEIKNKKISLDGATEKIFGFSTFEEFIDYVNLELKQSTVAASDKTLNLIRSAKSSNEWTRAITNGQPDTIVMRWLHDLGDRVSTHSAVGELFQVQKNQIAPYAEAARIGFCAIDHLMRKNKMKFQVKKTLEAGKNLVGDCCSLKATAPLLLQEVCEEVSEIIAQSISNLDSQMKQMIGPTPSKEKIYMTNSPMPFEITLWETAHRAAMLAAVSYDPTACEIYKGRFFQKTLIDPKTAEWFQNADNSL